MRWIVKYEISVVMNRIRKITRENKEIFIIDYSDCKESEMITLVSELKRQIFEDNKPVLILSIFNDKCYATPKFVRRAEQETREVMRLIKKQAMVGVNETKKMILKGYNFLFRKNIRVFDTNDAAIEFLLDEKTTDSDSFWDRNRN